MKMNKFEIVANCDMNSIVQIARNEEGKTTVTPMGMYSLDELAWYTPMNAVPKTFDQLDGTEEDCEPIITEMSLDEIAKTVHELGIKKVDQVSPFTPDGFYAVEFYPY